MPVLNSCPSRTVGCPPTAPSTAAAAPAILLVLASAAIVVLCIVAAWAGAHVHALDAAGAFNDKGKAIGGIKTFVDAIKGNLIWAMSVVAGLAVTLVGAMFMMGHTRAQDYALRAGMGFLILAGGSGIVS